MNRVLLFTNPTRDPEFAITRRIAAFLEGRGVEVERATEMTAPVDKTIELVISVGGDGTMLRVVPWCGGKPILGINAGSVGFLTAFDARDCEQKLQEVLAGRVLVTEHLMLRVSVLRDDQSIFGCDVLNDAVITGDKVAKTVVLDLSTNDRPMARMRGDGMIAATPTGSTAYSKSAGGPVLDPALGAFILTPICAHNLHVSAFVVPQNGGACITCVSEDLFLTVDGQPGITLQRGDRVLIRKSDRITRLMRLQNYNFYDIINRKLFDGR